MGRAPSRHRPPRIANGGGGAAPGLERARDWPARGPGRGAGEASAVSADIREGKVPCVESRAGARSYGGRSGRAGPARRAAEEDPRSRPRLPRCLSDLCNVPESGGLVHSGHGWRRKARRETGAAGGAHTAGGAPAHLPLGTDPPARPTRRQVAGHRAPCLRHQPLGTAAPRGQPPHRPPLRGGRHGKLAHSQRGGAWC